jgi:hypothetical protein
MQLKLNQRYQSQGLEYDSTGVYNSNQITTQRKKKVVSSRLSMILDYNNHLNQSMTFDNPIDPIVDSYNISDFRVSHDHG